MQKSHTFRRGEIYFADLGAGAGSVQGGIRPVLIIQNNTGNRYAPTLTVVPITAAIKKENLPTHCVFGQVLQSRSMFLAEQTQTIDKRKILRYAGKLNPEQLRSVMQAVCVHLGIVSREVPAPDPSDGAQSAGE